MAATAAADPAREALVALERWGSERGWRGRDPYDALNGSRVRLLGRTPLSRRLLIQLAKRSPLDLSRVLGVAPGENANSIAHVLSAYARMPDDLGIDAAARAEWCIDRLEALRAPGYVEPCWGYHFDVETRYFFYSRETPNTVATAFAGHALLDAAERRGSTRAAELAVGVGEFFMRRIEATPDPGGGAFLGYFPGDRTPIHNASLLAASLLARLAARGRTEADEEYAARARAAVAYALAHQRADGSWPYSEGPGGTGGWVDNFHSGYVLDALLCCGEALADEAALAAWDRGLALFVACLIDPDGAPRSTLERRYPIDGQSVAQSVDTLARASARWPERLADARRVLAWGLTNMRRADGAFQFQRGRRHRNRAAHVRWVQAPMLSALVTLLEAEGAAR